MHRYRSYKCSELNLNNSGEEVKLSGWIHRKRDHGNLLFIDLRDNYGLTQCVIENTSTFFKTLDKIRPESVISVSGNVVKRPEDTFNKNLPTGEIEIHIKGLEVLSEAQELPLPVFGEPEYPEDIRLKYRFLDLRRKKNSWKYNFKI